MSVPRLGVGLQFNPALVGWFPFLDQPLDALEILFDAVMGPLDGPGLMSPRAAATLQDAAVKVAERLRKAIEKAEWPHRPVTASFGVAALSTSEAIRGCG